MKSFLELQATQVALELAAEVYQLCRKLPKSEMFGISSQVKRAVASVVANIAEGFGRYSYKDKANRYTIARGECSEVVAFLYVAERVGLLAHSDVADAIVLAEQAGKLLSGLIASSRDRATFPVS